MGYARVRDGKWQDIQLQDLEGQKLYWSPKSEWVKSICFDGMGTGLYVLTEDDDSYFTAPSIDLEFSDTLYKFAITVDEVIPHRYEVYATSPQEAFETAQGQLRLHSGGMITGDWGYEIIGEKRG